MENGYVYTSENGSNKSAYADQVTGKPIEARNPALQLKAGREKRLSTDDGSHLIAHSLGGKNTKENLIAMDRGLNRGTYKSMESAVKKAVENNPDSKVSMQVNTNGSSERPDTIQVTTKMTDSQGKVKDVSHTSYTNLNKHTQEALNKESGTDFDGYQDTLTKEQRDLANKASQELENMKINDGLDKGWKYVKREDTKMSDHERHQKFTETLKVETKPVVTTPNTNSKKTVSSNNGENRERELDILKLPPSRSEDSKSFDLKTSKTTSSVSKVSSVGKTINNNGKNGSNVSSVGKTISSTGKNGHSTSSVGKTAVGQSNSSHGGLSGNSASGGISGGKGGSSGLGGHGSSGGISGGKGGSGLGGSGGLGGHGGHGAK